MTRAEAIRLAIRNAECSESASSDTGSAASSSYALSSLAWSHIAALLSNTDDNKT
jgi:hypothetical protein